MRSQVPPAYRKARVVAARPVAALAAKAHKCRTGNTSIAKLCFATGGRWGETEALQVTQVRGGVVQFANATKSKRARAVPISKELQNEIEVHAKKHGDGQRVLGYAYAALLEAIGRAGLDLPRGQASHVLRHTFAPHFMIGGGNIIALQRILGHHSLAMTMRYAHLAPDHLQEAVTLNPLAKNRSRKSVGSRTKSRPTRPA